MLTVSFGQNRKIADPTPDWHRSFLALNPEQVTISRRNREFQRRRFGGCRSAWCREADSHWLVARWVINNEPFIEFTLNAPILFPVHPTFWGDEVFEDISLLV